MKSRGLLARVLKTAYLAHMTTWKFQVGLSLLLSSNTAESFSVSLPLPPQMSSLICSVSPSLKFFKAQTLERGDVTQWKARIEKRPWHQGAL